MNLLGALLHLVALVAVNCSAAIEPWASCVREVLQRNAVTVHSQVNAYALDEPSFRFAQDLLDLLLPSLETNGSFSVTLAPYPRTVDFNHRNLVIIVADSLDSFGDHIGQLIGKNVEWHGYFLVLLSSMHDVTLDRMSRILERLWDFRVSNVLFAMEQVGASGGSKMADSALTDSGIELVSYTPYGPGCCGCARPHVIDRCVEGRLANSSVALYDRFERNLYGCELRIAAFERAPFMMFSRDAQLQRLSGIEGELVELLAAKLNFTVTIVQPPDGRVWGRIYPNGSTNGAMKLLMDGEVHLTLGRYFPYPRLLDNTTQSNSYYIADLVLAVPEALVTITPLQQLLKPFQWDIWLALLAEVALYYGVLYLIACVIPFDSEKTALGFWRILLGESLPVLPRTTRIRLATVCWIMHTTILRECYKCSLVSFLTEPTPLTDIRSIDALLRSGYRFAMTETLYHKVFHNSSKIDHRLLLVDALDARSLMQRTLETGARIAIANTREEIGAFNALNSSIINYRTSDEKLLTFHFSMYFKRSSPVVTAFDWYIQRIVDSGHIRQWRTRYADQRHLRATLTNGGQAQVLNLRHLTSCFLLLVGGLTLACFVFTLEVLLFKHQPVQTTTVHRHVYLD